MKNKLDYKQKHLVSTTRFDIQLYKNVWNVISGGYQILNKHVIKNKK